MQRQHPGRPVDVRLGAGSSVLSLDVVGVGGAPPVVLRALLARTEQIVRL